MNTKCGICGKFIASTGTDCAQCAKCTTCYHRACVVIAPNVKIPKTWSCPGCARQKSPTPVCQMVIDDVAHNETIDFSDSAKVALDIVSFREEQQSLRAFFNEQFLSLRTGLREEIREMRIEFAEIHTCLQAYSERVDSFDARITKLEERIAAIPAVQDAVISRTIEDLRDQLNERDQELLRNDIDVSGVPEGSDDPGHIVKLLAVKLGVPLEDRDIVHAERVGLKRHSDRPANDSAPGTRPRTIAVRFTRRSTRDQMLQAARVRRDITSADLEQAGAPRRIYLNERLSRTNRGLFARAREAGRKANYRYIWTREGRVYARQADGRPAERIRADVDIEKKFHA